MTESAARRPARTLFGFGVPPITLDEYRHAALRDCVAELRARLEHADTDLAELTQQATDHYREQNGRADRAEQKAASIQAGAATGIPTEWKMVVGSSARRAARKTQKSAVGAKRSGTGSIGTRVPDSSSHSSIGAVRQASVRAPVRWGDELTWSRSARRGPAVAAVVQRREVLRQRGAGVRNYPTAESHALRDARSSDPPLTLPADGGRTRPHLEEGVIGKAYDTELKKGGRSCDSSST
jgi:hypothetical protein